MGPGGTMSGLLRVWPARRRAAPGVLVAGALACSIAWAGGPLSGAPPVAATEPLVDGPLVVGEPGPTPRLTGSRPDIVLLMVDDIGDVGLRVWRRLPTIGRLFVEQGTRFTSYFGNDPLCCPGRAAVLTGQRTSHHRVVDNDAGLLDARVTLATELRDVGYHTIYAGKYLNRTGALEGKTPPGWDHALIFSGGYWNATLWSDGARFASGSAIEDYTTDLIARATLGWLATAPPDQPLLLFLSPYAVHMGLDRYGRSFGLYQPAPAPRHLRDPRCADMGRWRPPGYDESDVADKPAHIRALSPVPYPRGWPLERICETLLSVDELLAQVEATLAEQGRRDVLLILTADNGMAFGAHRWRLKRAPYAARMPLLMHWERGLGGVSRRIETVVSNIDLAPTLCDLAGCEMGPFPDGGPVDGLSLVPLLDGTSGSLARDHLLEEHHTLKSLPPWRGVRTTDESPLGRWVYTRYATGEEELYDLAADPWQLVNLAADPSHAAVRAALADLSETPVVPILRRGDPPLR